MDKKNYFKYKSWKYKLMENMELLIEHPIEEPKHLYKYYPPTKYSLDGVLKNYLFPNHPYRFNDSMDTNNLLWDFKKMTKELHDGFYETYGILDDQYVPYEDGSVSNFNNFRHNFHDWITARIGLISLTSTPLNVLMWSHYSTEKGFMIGLDHEILENKKYALNPDLANIPIYPINYVEQLEKMEMFTEGLNSPVIPFLYIASVKNKAWEYENEWRIATMTMPGKVYDIPHSIIMPIKDIKGNIDRKLNYPKEALKMVVLGKYFFNGSNLKNFSLDKKENGIYELKDIKTYSFLKYLSELKNCEIFQSGELEQKSKFKRSAELVVFEFPNKMEVKVIPQGRGFQE